MCYKADIKSLRLDQLDFRVIEDKVNEPVLDVEVKTEITDSLDDVLQVCWDVFLKFDPFFHVSVRYSMNVVKDGQRDGVEDIELLKKRASYPILAELSWLIATLTKSHGAIPLVIDPSELLELGGIEID